VTTADRTGTLPPWAAGQYIISSSLLCLTAGGAGGHEFTKLEWWCSWLMGWLSWASSWPPGPVWEGVATGAVRECERGSPWSGVPRGLCFISEPGKKNYRSACVAAGLNLASEEKKIAEFAESF
jgi:hypothetical protein